MNKKDKLKSVISKARFELSQIEEAESVKFCQTLVGRFFKFKNSYSSDDNWWLYTTVTGVNGSGEAICWSFQKDIYGQVEVEDGIFRSFLGSGNIEIPEKEFWKEYSSIMEELSSRIPT